MTMLFVLDKKMAVFHLRGYERWLKSELLAYQSALKVGQRFAIATC